MTDRNQIITDNLYLVDNVLKRFKNHNIGIFTLDDLYQEGSIGLIKAVDLGNSESPYFKSYLTTAIYNAMLRKIQLTKKFANEILPNVEVDENGEEVVTGIPPVTLLKIVPDSASLYDKYLVQYLTEKAKEADIKVQKGVNFLLFSIQGYSQGEIAKAYGIENKKVVSAYISAAKKYFRQDKEFLKLCGDA